MTPPGVTTGDLKGRLSSTLGFIATTLLTIWAAVSMTFLLMRISGNPLVNSIGDRVSEAELQRRLEAAGLNRPLYEQYFDYLWDLARFDLGGAAITNRPVIDIVLGSLPATTELALIGAVTGTLLALALLWLALRFNERLLDRLLRVSTIAIYALPSFLLAAFGKLIFSSWLGWLPSSGRYSIATQLVLQRSEFQTGFTALDLIAAGRPELLLDHLWHATLPALTIGTLFAAGLFRGLRPHLASQLNSNHVRGARAKGLAEIKVILRAALRPVAATAISVWSFFTAWLLGGAVLAEIVFEWGGIGATLAEQIGDRDYIAVQGIVIAIATIVIINFRLADLVSRIFDPRLRERAAT